MAGILEAMGATGVDMFLDVHADECCPYAFAAGSEGNPNHDDAIARDEAGVRDNLAALTDEFIDVPFYGLDAQFEADPSCASSQVGARFDCPSLTLELPFKDCGDERVPERWSPERRAALRLFAGRRAREGR